MRALSRIILCGLAAIIAGVALMAPSSLSAADHAYAPKPQAVVSIPAPQLPPFASKLSASVFASGGCWRACEAQCGGEFQVCLRFEPVEACHADINACSRMCLRQCRTMGGPFLPWTD
jgi:hypothetical protein